MTSGEQHRAGPQMSDDGRFWWDGERWQPVSLAPAQGGHVGAVFWGVLLALVVLIAAGWFTYSVVHANDDVTCAGDNAQRAIDGLPPKDC